MIIIFLFLWLIIVQENIVTFLKACSKLGFGDEKLFDTIDLFENKDPNKVCAMNNHARIKQRKKESKGSRARGLITLI